MAWDQSSPGDGSTWGLPHAPPTEHGLGTSEEARYASVGRVGSGGMGVVEAVYDARLQREVACKRPAPGIEPSLALAMLAHEARVTARLDHPNVVALHDAGLDAVGRPYFTMPLLRGVTLADLLASEPTPPLTRLVRHLLDASRGVAHAHERGVVHADLKPSNVLVGAHGETWVADWGLAYRREGEQPPVAPGAGTPPWSAPEVRAGERPTERADVYALGVMLGQFLHAADPSGLMVELRAVCRQASEPDPARRYPNASAVAAELERWLDGRPVHAHPYTPAQLLRRFVQAWRVPLLLGSIGSLALLAIAGLAAVRTAAERDRAVAAEAQLTTTAASLWADRAVTALAARDELTAVEAAHAALALRPSAAASGVLAAIGPLSSPPADAPLPACARLLRLLHDGVLCADGDRLDLLDLTGATVRSWPVTVTDATDAGPGHLWLMVDRQIVRLHRDTGALVPTGVFGAERGLTGGLPGYHTDRISVYELGEAPTQHTPCPTRDNIDAVAAAPGRGWWTVCSYGQVMHAPPDEPPRALFDGGARFAGVVALGLSHDGDLLLAGTLHGEVIAIDAHTGEERGRVAAGVGAIREVRPAPTGDLLAAIGADGRARLLRPLAQVTLGPVPWRGVRDLRWTHEGQAWVAAHDGLHRLSLPHEPAVSHWEEHGGISAIALSADAGLLAVGVGPDLVLRDLRTGRRTGGHLDHERPIKGLTFDPTGVISGAVDERHALLRYDLLTGEAQPLGEAQRLRRLARTDAGHLLAMDYGSTVYTSAPAPLQFDRHRTGAAWVELLGGPGASAWALTDAGDLLSVDARTGDFETQLPGDLTHPDRRLARSAAGHRLARANDELVRIAPADDPAHPLATVPRPATAIALDPAGDLLAIGTLDGEVELWHLPSATLTWTARAHSSRVSAVLFASPDLLISAGWDGRVQRWQVHPTAAPPR